MNALDPATLSALGQNVNQGLSDSWVLPKGEKTPVAQTLALLRKGTSSDWHKVTVSQEGSEVANLARSVLIATATNAAAQGAGNAAENTTTERP